MPIETTKHQLKFQVNRPTDQDNPGDCPYDLTPRSPHAGKPYKEVPLQQLKKDLLYWNKQDLSGPQKAKVDVANAYVATVSKEGS